MKIFIYVVFIINYLIASDLPSIVDKKEVYTNKKISWEYDKTNKVYKLIKGFKNKELEKLLKDGKNANTYFQFKYPYTFLHLATEVNNKDAVKLLLKYKANINALSFKDDNIQTAISNVILNDDISFTKYLIKNGAKLNISQVDYDRLSCDYYHNIIYPPLFYAKSKNMIKFLVSENVNISQKSIDGKTLLDFLNKNIILKNWVMKTYTIPQEYFTCSNKRKGQIVKVIHSKTGAIEYDIKGNYFMR